jgi:hypothetical protein
MNCTSSSTLFAHITNALRAGVEHVEDKWARLYRVVDI